jgi:hypothetical protein
MKRLSLLFLLAGCVVEPTPDPAADPTPTPTPTPPATAIEAVCGPELEPGTESLPSTPLNGTWACDGDCELALPAEVATATDPMTRFAGELLAITAGVDALIVASEAGVHELQVDHRFTFDVDGELLWFASAEGVIAATPEGEVRRRCTLPGALSDDLAFVSVAAGELFVGGFDPAVTERQVWQATLDGWALVPVDIGPDRVVEVSDSQVLILGYGYYHALDLEIGDTEQLGGSDDDFSQVAACADGTYWVGGMTGMTLLCDPDHECTDRRDHSPFGIDSVRCEPDGRIAWRWGFPEWQIWRLDADGVTESEPPPPGLRLFGGHRGRGWTLVDAP